MWVLKSLALMQISGIRHVFIHIGQFYANFKKLFDNTYHLCHLLSYHPILHAFHYWRSRVSQFCKAIQIFPSAIYITSFSTVRNNHEDLPFSWSKLTWFLHILLKMWLVSTEIASHHKILVGNYLSLHIIFVIIIMSTNNL